ncbi:unnamed protein product, partial [Notodromas monacha]
MRAEALDHPVIMNGKFEYQSTDHGSRFQTVISHLFTNSYMVDVTLACVDGVLKAHQVILAAFSPYFQGIFGSNPCQHPVVLLHNVPLSVVGGLVRFMYEGVMSCSISELPGILDLARSLQIRGLENLHSQGSTTHSPAFCPTQEFCFETNGSANPERAEALLQERSTMGNTSYIRSSGPTNSLCHNAEIHKSPSLPVQGLYIETLNPVGTLSQSEKQSSSKASTPVPKTVNLQAAWSPNFSPSQGLCVQNTSQHTEKVAVNMTANNKPQLEVDGNELLVTEENNCLAPLNLSPNRPAQSSSETQAENPSYPEELEPESIPELSDPPQPVNDAKKSIRKVKKIKKTKTAKQSQTKSFLSRRRGRPKAMSQEVVTFVCLEEEGKSRYNSMYNKKARELGLKSGWNLLEDRIRRTLKGNSKDRSKGVLEKSRMVLKFCIPGDLINLSENGTYDFYNPDTGHRGHIHDPAFSADCKILTLKALVRQTQFALKEEQLAFIKEGNMAAASCYGRRAVTESLQMLATLQKSSDRAPDSSESSPKPEANSFLSEFPGRPEVSTNSASVSGLPNLISGSLKSSAREVGPEDVEAVPCCLNLKFGADPKKGPCWLNPSRWGSGDESAFSEMKQNTNFYLLKKCGKMKWCSAAGILAVFVWLSILEEESVDANPLANPVAEANPDPLALPGSSSGSGKGKKHYHKHHHHHYHKHVHKHKHGHKHKHKKKKKKPMSSSSGSSSGKKRSFVDLPQLYPAIQKKRLKKPVGKDSENDVKSPDFPSSQSSEADYVEIPASPTSVAQLDADAGADEEATPIGEKQKRRRKGRAGDAPEVYQYATGRHPVVLPGMDEVSSKRGYTDWRKVEKERMGGIRVLWGNIECNEHKCATTVPAAAGLHMRAATPEAGQEKSPLHPAASIPLRHRRHPVLGNPRENGFSEFRKLFVENLHQIITYCAVYGSLGMSSPHFTLLGSTTMLALTIAVVPLCTHILALVVVIAVMGFFMGTVDVVSNVCMMQLFDKKVGPFLQCLHFCYGLGAFLSPLVVEPFLLRNGCPEKHNNPYHKAAHSEGHDSTMHSVNASEHISNHSSFNNTESYEDSEADLEHAYWSMAVIQIPTIVLTASLLLRRKLSGMDDSHEADLVYEMMNKGFEIKGIINKWRDPDAHSEFARGSATEIQTRMVTYLASSMTFLADGLQAVFGSYIYTFAVMYVQGMDAANGAHLTASFWGMFAFGRFLSIGLATKLGPATILLLNTSGTLLSIALLVFFPHNHAAFYIGASCFG